MHPDVITSVWDDPRNVDLLKAMYAEGATASQIAAALGQGISRNAVIGKVTRLNLPKRGRNHIAAVRRAGPGNPGQPKVNGIAARADKRHRSAALAMRPHARETPFRESTLPPEDDAGVDYTGRMKFAVRRIGHECSWIFGEPVDGAVCCGKPVVDGTEWCAEHRDRVFAGKTPGY